MNVKLVNLEEILSKNSSSLVKRCTNDIVLLLLHPYAGYGHITPETPLGQICTMVYCFFGLPISMLTLKTLGELVSEMINKFVYTVETKVLGRRKPRRVRVKSFFLIFALMLLTLCAFGLTQSYLEGWTFIEGFYAWFVTLSTIGYGDYLPALDLLRKAKKSSDSEISLLLIISASALPYLAGLCMVSGVLNSLVDVVEESRIIKTYKMITKKAEDLKEEREKLKCFNRRKNESEHDDGFNLTMFTKRPRSASV